MSLANRPFAEDDGVPVTEFLLLDEQQLLPFVNTLPQPFDPSSAFSMNSFMELSDSQKSEFGSRVLKVYELLGWGLHGRLDVNDLDSRLQKVANERTGSPDLGQLSRSLKSNAHAPSVSSWGPGVLDKDVPMHEVGAHRALVRDGARPVCSLEEMAQIRAAPSERYKAVLPWLTEDPDFEPGRHGECPAFELRDMFYSQWQRWWSFRKTQWIIRGLGDSEAGERAFCEADKRRLMDSGEEERVSSSSYAEFPVFMWQTEMPREELRPLEDQTFATYSNAARSRIALYQFKKPMQLKKDPLKQTSWTNWLEYLNYELMWLEFRTAAADALESRYQEHTKKLRDAIPSEGYDRDAPASTNIEPNDLAAARARLDASQDAIRNFLQNTERYTTRRNRAFYQRHRVEWIVKEARLMEAEMAQQSGAGTKRKRKQDEDPAEPQQQPPQKKAAPDGPRRSARLGAQRGKSHKV